MFQKAFFFILLGIGIQSHAADQMDLNVLDTQTETFYMAQYVPEKRMYIPVKIDSKHTPNYEGVIEQAKDKKGITPLVQILSPAYRDGRYIATYSNRAIIGSPRFEDIFQVYVCRMYQSCDHISGTIVQFDKDVSDFWAGKPCVIQAKTEIKEGKKNGISKMYYPNGKLGETCEFKNGVENGAIVQYYPNGRFKWKGNYKNGKLNGLDQTFYENGKVHVETTYVNNVQEGPVKVYHENGTVMLSGHKKGKFIYDGVLYDERGKMVRKLPPESPFSIKYDDLSWEKIQKMK